MALKSFRLLKILGICGLIFLIVLWFLFFFFPNMVEVNHLKRQNKDLNDLVRQNINSGDLFAYPNEAELVLFKKMEEDLKTSLPTVSNADEFLRQITRVSKFLKESAAREGLGNLIVSSNSQDLEINAQTLPWTGRPIEELLQFASTRLRELQLQTERKRTATQAAEGDGSPDQTGEANPFGLSSHILYVTFNGELKRALTFLHKLPALDRSLRIEKLVVSEGHDMPLFLVHARLYFWDPKQKGSQVTRTEAVDAQE